MNTGLRLIVLALLLAAAQTTGNAQNHQVNGNAPKAKFESHIEFILYKDIEIAPGYNWEVESQATALSGFGIAELGKQEQLTFHVQSLSLNRYPWLAVSASEGASNEGGYAMIGFSIDAKAFGETGKKLDKYFETLKVSHYVRIKGSENHSPNQIWIMACPRSPNWRNLEVELENIYIIQRGDNFGRFGLWVSHPKVERFSFGGELEVVGKTPSLRLGFKVKIQ